MSLYALKPAFGAALRPVAQRLHGSPDAITAAGVTAAAAAAVVLATMTGAVAAAVVAALLVVRLACANLDGQVARSLGTASPRGALANEVGDRVADLLPLLGLWAAGASSALVLLAAIASSAPSWVSLAARSAGLEQRLQSGPMGKVERCAAVALAPVVGSLVSCGVLVLGGALTIAVRLRRAVVAL